jgi:hypothetical protein
VAYALRRIKNHARRTPRNRREKIPRESISGDFPKSNSSFCHKSFPAAGFGYLTAAGFALRR